jgi:hypothetical protein
MLPILIAGAISDIKTRTFPKAYWKGNILIPAAVVMFQYMTMIQSSQFYLIGLSAGIALISWIVCAFMGIRYGSGGDWRALMYIGIISPLLMLSTVVIALFAGAIMGILAWGAVPKGTNPLKITIPFAVAILIGYAGSLMIFIYVNW